MTLKLIGAILIGTCCAGYGFSLAHNQRRQTQALRQLIATLEWMICELEYRLTPLPELCRIASCRGGWIGNIFKSMAECLEKSQLPDARECMEIAISKHRNLSPRLEEILLELGRSLGRFSLSGQVLELKAAAALCKRELSGLEAGQDNILRTYRTLGICAGAALVILFL